jgi:hypothetical protein
MKFSRTTHSIKIICAATVALFAAINSSANAVEDPAQLAQDTPTCAEMGATMAIAGEEIPGVQSARRWQHVLGSLQIPTIERF